uniref:Bifunctional inhibitor/plant lipid transfer protein/seed storage helical domain-containing protein n=1 Tax=Leersia perrieri TaxID=77586 RepID=A0A0D9X7J9_9ORYZ
MLQGKVAFLLLLMCAIISPHAVIGFPCTKKQREKILITCKDFIRMIGSSPSLPVKSGPCCEAVRQPSLVEEKCLIEIACVFYEYALIFEISNSLNT